MSTSKIPTALQHRDTMQKCHEAFVECLQNNGFSYSPQCYKNSNEKSLEPKCTSEFNQGTGGKEQDGAASGKSMHIRPNESSCLPVQQQNYYFCSGYQTNFTKEMPNQAHLIQNHIYAPNDHYFPAHNRLPYVPLQFHSSSYQQDYNFQDFQYFVVIDFEATCDKEKNPHPQEIIEFPSVLVNCSTGQLEDSFQKYVRPTHNQMLSDFCKELTGIQQSQVDKGVLLSEALLMHDKWLEEKGIKHTNFAVVTWSNWDCRVMLESECRFKRIRKPPYFNRWINLKVPFLKVFGGTKCNLKEAVQLAGLTWEGRAHCGLDDAKNTARLLTLLMHRGFRFSITNSLFWQATDYPYTLQPHTAPTEWSPQKWKTPPFYTLVPFQTVQATPTKEELTFCYCGVASIKRIIRKPGPKQGSFFFGCGNWTATRGAQCPYFTWASTANGPKSI